MRVNIFYKQFLFFDSFIAIGLIIIMGHLLFYESEFGILL
jgi:hypothetical protein